MTDERFKEILRQKASARRKKILEVRRKEKETRILLEAEYKKTVEMLASFRKYVFIVLKINRKYETIYGDSPYESVKALIEQVEKHYTETGEVYETIKYLKR